MINKIKNALLCNKSDGTIYLIEKLSDLSGFFLAEGKLMYMVKNGENLDHESVSTEFLSLNTNISICAIENSPQFESGNYNILEFKDNLESANFDAFVSLCEAHTQSIDEIGFMKFFYSLINLFQYPKEQQFKNLLGLYGELKFIEYVFNELSTDISTLWHKNGSYDKYDFVCKKTNFEVKTTASKEMVVTLKHAQLFNADKNYLVVVCAENSNSGETINELITKMRNSKLYCSNFNFNFNIEKEKKRISPIDADIMRFTMSKICFFNASDINPFSEIPDGISDIKYNYDLSLQQELPIEYIKNLI